MFGLRRGEILGISALLLRRKAPFRDRTEFSSPAQTTMSSPAALDVADCFTTLDTTELDIRSLKTHMQMEHLRCKSPSMVRKEIYAHLIAYNLIRDLIVHASIIYETSPKRLSHKGTVQALNAFAEKLDVDSVGLEALEGALYESLTGN